MKIDLPTLFTSPTVGKNTLVILETMISLLTKKKIRKIQAQCEDRPCNVFCREKVTFLYNSLKEIVTSPTFYAKNDAFLLILRYPVVFSKLRNIFQTFL